MISKRETYFKELTEYAKTHTLKECAKYFAKEYKAVQAFCKKHNIVPVRESKTGKNNPAYKHGMEHTSLCNSYRNMLARCSNKKRKDYKYYGARGIKVFEGWKKDSSLFFTWAKNNGYKEGLTLDRIDVNGNYTPDNCRWVNFKIQCNNRRSNIYCEYKGKRKTLIQWCKELSLNYDTVRHRLKRGVSVNEAFKKEKESRTITNEQIDLLLIKARSRI